MTKQPEIIVKLESLIRDNQLEIIYKHSNKSSNYAYNYFIAPKKDISSMEELNGLYYKLVFNLGLDPELHLPFHKQGRIYPATGFHGASAYYEGETWIHLAMGPTKAIVQEDIKIKDDLRWENTYKDVFDNKESIRRAEKYFSQPKDTVYSLESTDSKKVFIKHNPDWSDLKYIVNKINLSDFVEQVFGISFLGLKRLNDFQTKTGDNYYSFDTESDINASAKLVDVSSETESHKDVPLFIEDFATATGFFKIWGNHLIDKGQNNKNSTLKLLDMYTKFTEPSSRRYLKLTTKKYDSYFSPTTSSVFAIGKYNNNSNIDIILRASNFGPSICPELRVNDVVLQIVDHKNKSLIEKIYCSEKNDLDALPKQVVDEFQVSNLNYGSKIYLNKENKFKKEIYDSRIKTITKEIFKELNCATTK